MSRRRTLWDEFRVNPEGPSQDYPKVRQITREMPEIIPAALATEDHTERWKVIRTWAEAHPKRSALKSFDWLTATLMSFDDVAV